MSPTIGSLCTGYGGLDLAAEQVTGGTTVWHCENEPAPSKLLALRFPGVPNHHDVKALAWAEHPVDVLTGGYPCQPFSGAGKRLGTDDPRHLFPWIAQGVGRMRPPLLLLENVRGHLSLGFDVVLAELHRLDYDVRWTLLRASDVGAPHGRARLWIAARAREVGGWPRPSGQPTAYADGQGGWSAPQSGLFGEVAARTPGAAGVMVDGARWDSDADANRMAGLLPTPTARLGDASSRGASHPARRKELCPKRGGELDEVAVHLLGQPALLPTPQAHDGQGGTKTPEQVATMRARGHGVSNLGEVVEHALLPTPRATRGGSATETTYLLQSDGETRTLLPTPRARDGKGCDPNPRGVDLNQAVHDALLPTPTTQPQTGNGHARNLGSEIKHLLPTPAAADAKRARASTTARDRHGGTTLDEQVCLLPTPRATDGTKGGPNQRGSSGDLMLPSAVQLLPTPCAKDSGNSPEEHLRKKPGRDQVTSLQVLVDGGLLETGGRLGAPTADLHERADNGTHGNPDHPLPGQGLPDLRGDIQPEALQGDARESAGLLEADDLFAGVCKQSGRGDQGRAALAGTQAPEAGVRALPGDEGASRPPRRSGPGEQRPGEPSDAVRDVPPAAALAGGPRRADGSSAASDADGHGAWGPYAGAIRRWEMVLGRVAPPPTEAGRSGPRLSPIFVEFLMGLDLGWVTDVPSLTRNQQLTMLGNGVVPQCAVAAYTLLGVTELSREAAA